MASYPVVVPDGTHWWDGWFYGEPGEYYQHSSIVHLVNDDNDGTYAYGVSNAVSEMRVQNIALAGTQRCAALRAGIRARAGTDPPYDTVHLDMWLKPWHSGDRAGVELRGAISRNFTDYWGPWHNGEFFQNTLNDMMVAVRENWVNYATDISKLWIQADIRTQPNVTTTGPGAHLSTGHPLRPTVTWSANYMGDSARQYQVHIRRISDSALIWDSGVRWGAPGALQVETDLVAGVQYAAIVQVSTDFLGGDWWSAWSNWHYFTVEGPPTSTVTAPTGVLTTTNTPTIVFTYTGVSAKNAHRVKIFSQTDIDSVGFNPDTSPAWYDSNDVGGNGLTQVTNVPLPGGQQFRAYVKVRNSNNTWSTSWAVGPQFSILAAGVDKPQRVLFALSGPPGPQNGGGYIEFDDTKRAGSFAWKSAPVRSPDGRQVEVREVQVYVKTYDPNATISVTVGATTRVVTIPTPSRQQIPFLFKERGETLDVRIVSSAGTPASNEAPSLEVVRIGWKPLHQLRKP